MRILKVFYVVCCTLIAPELVASSLHKVGEFSIPAGTRLFEEGTGVWAPLQGISGLAYDAAENTWFAAVNDRARPRLFTFSFNLNPGKFEAEAKALWFVNVPTYREDKRHGAYELGGVVVDAESKSLIVAGQTRNNLRENKSYPALIRMTFKANYLSVVTDVPGTSFGAEEGAIEGHHFQSLALSPDGTHLYTALAWPLKQDDSPAGFSKTATTRIVAMDLHPERKVFQPKRQYPYVLDSVRVPSGAGEKYKQASNGLVEIAAADNDDTLFTLETSSALREDGTRLALGSRIYSVRASKENKNVAPFISLRDAKAEPLAKNLLWDSSSLLQSSQRNYEAMAVGPLMNGHRTLLVTSNDAEDQKPTSENVQVLVFEIVD